MTAPQPAPRGPSTPAPVPAAVWRARGPAADDPAVEGRVLAVAAHPDDEVIGAGALLAEHVAGSGGAVQAVTLTVGERCVTDPAFTEAELAGRRLGEWRTALGLLGATALDAPRWPDGALAEHEDEAVALLTDLLDDVDTVVAVWAHDPHPDHRAAGRAARRAAAARDVHLVEYAVWTPYWLTPAQVAEHGGRLVTTTTSEPARRRREAALAAHRSQLEPLRPGWEPVVPAALLDRNHGDAVVAVATGA